MEKTRSFSIYLLKAGYNSANALVPDHKMAEASSKKAPDGSAIFIHNGAAAEPWWRDYLGITTPLLRANKSALLFLPVKHHTLVFSFGHAYHRLKDESFEYDFGLRVTLNCVDPKEIKSTDTLDPTAALRKRTQAPIGSDLTFLDFDEDNAMLKSLTGKVLEKHKHLFTATTGSSSLNVRSKSSVAELSKLSKELINLYQSESYKETFPEIDNISPVNDPAILSQLRLKLVKGVQDKSDALFLTIPDLIDYREEGLSASFAGFGPSELYDDLYIDQFYEYVTANGKSLSDLTYDDLKAKRVRLSSEDTDFHKKDFSLLNCFIFDTQLSDSSEVYHLTEGKWYRVEKNYLKKLAKFINPLWVTLPLPEFTQESEGDYNEAVAQSSASYLCLDRTSIKPDGQTPVEPCDLYSVANKRAIFTHVKRSTMSAQLSHLFNQGVNAVELLKLVPESKDRLQQLLKKRVNAAKLASYVAPLHENAYDVVFGIITHKKQTDKKSDLLPLFSRISLMRVARSLHLMNVGCRIGFIREPKAKKQS